MVPKNVLAATVGAALLAWSGACFAADYQPGDFLHLDLSKAVLSPKRLGPTTQFAPFPVEAAGDAAENAAQARAEPKAAPKAAAPRVRTAQIRVEKHRAEKPRGAARTRLAHRHSNPLDAEAFDRRIQVWPCKSGGICDWQRQ
jgi:hypothetical protein